jgi:GTP-binding protein
MEFSDPSFVISAHGLKQLPDSDLPEIAFAGRSNVGKSSLLNTLLKRKNLVKVSGRPGKTQGLNFFLVSDSFYLVDLPGYGFAQVSRSMQASWGELISSYLETRTQLCCVVVILDIRHEAKGHDNDLIMWLKNKKIPVLPVYTKADKLSGNKKEKCAGILDAGHGFSKDERVVFSAKTGEGRDALVEKISRFLLPE